MKATIYSTTSCPACKVAKKFLEDKHVDVQEFKVDLDESKCNEMIQKTGGTMSVPVIDIGGEIVIGFSPTKLNNLLSIS
jgi:glutaredoxin-like YruB-family protein